MNIETFLEKARTSIPDDPKDRLTFLAKTYLEHPDGIADIHIHIFDKRCLSIGYILLRLLKTAGLKAMGIELDGFENMSKDEEQVYDELSTISEESEEEWQLFEKELENIEDLYETHELFGYDVKEAFKILKKKNMLEILDFYHQEYSITKLPEFSNCKLVTGILQMDLETGWGFSPRRKFKQQIEDIKKISKDRPIIPYLALDPRRVDIEGSKNNLYELFLEAFSDVDTPFFGVKCYPSLGYFPWDIRLDPIFQICAEKGIPVLTHCGGTTVSSFRKKFTLKDENGYREFIMPGNSRAERANYMNSPDHWEPVLNKYNNLKINFGHFGGDSNWAELGETGSNDRLEKIFSLMENPNLNVFADFSFTLIEEKLFNIFKEVLDSRPEIAARTLYGTDYWVVVPSSKLLEEQDEFLKQLPNHQTAMLRDNIIKYLLN